MGYPFGKKGWKVFDLDKYEIFVSRDVVFHEDVFPSESKTKIAYIVGERSRALDIGAACDDVDMLNESMSKLV